MVSKEVLIQYSDLQSEIKYLSKRIDRLRSEKVKYEAKKKRDKVKASYREYPYIEHNVYIEGMTNLNEMMLNSTISKELRNLEKRYDRLLEVTNDVLDYIESIEDSHIRMIVTYRFIENYSWAKVAEAMGGGNTEDSVRKAFERFLEKN